MAQDKLYRTSSYRKSIFDKQVELYRHCCFFYMFLMWQLGKSICT
jgi:hypothetical protein